MAEANGVFVHLFRNKEEFEKRKDSLEMAKNKFEAEKEYRLKLAESAGLKNASLQAQIPQNFGAELIPTYSKFRDREDPMYKMWINFGKGYYSTCFWPEIGDVYVPVEVLEEMRLVAEYRIFEGVRLFYSDTAWLLVGGITNSGPRYLIAYWGSKEVHDKIQEKLAELQRSKAEAEAAKLKEEQTKAEKEENSEIEKKSSKKAEFWSNGPGAFLIAVSVLIVLISGVSALHEVLKDTHALIKQRTPSEAKAYSELVYSQVLTPYDCDLLHTNSIQDSAGTTVIGKVTEKCQRHGEHYVLDCRNYRFTRRVPVSQFVFTELEVGDKLVCKICEEIHSSIYELPNGKILDKDENWRRCIIKNDYHHGVTVEGKGIVFVTKSVFDKVKVGDQVPFKRPEY